MGSLFCKGRPQAYLSEEEKMFHSVEKEYQLTESQFLKFKSYLTYPPTQPAQEDKLFQAYSRAFPYGKRRREHFEGLKVLFLQDLNLAEFHSHKFILASILLLSKCSEEAKISYFLSLYGTKGLKEMLENIFTFVVECIPRLVLQAYGKSDKLTNVCEVMQRRSSEVLECLKKELVPEESLSNKEFVIMFSEELAYLLNPQGIRNALLPYFINHSLIGSTLASAEEIVRKPKKRVTFALD